MASYAKTNGTLSKRARTKELEALTEDEVMELQRKSGQSVKRLMRLVCNLIFQATYKSSFHEINPFIEFPFCR